MANYEDADELRRAIKDYGVAKLAKEARIRPTTLYSFCSNDPANRTEQLRSDTRDKVMAVLNKHNPSDTTRLMNYWSQIVSPASRNAVIEMVRGLAESEQNAR